MSGSPTIRSPVWNTDSSTCRVMTRATVIVVSALLLITSVTFACRRIWFAGTGLFDATSTAPGVWLAMGTFGLVMIAAVQRLLWADARPWQSSTQLTHGDLGVCGMSSVYAIVGSLTLGSLATGLGWQTLIVLLIAVEELWAVRFVRAGLPGPRQVKNAVLKSESAAHDSSVSEEADATKMAFASTQSADMLDQASEDTDEELLGEDEAVWRPPGVTQQLTRGVDPTRGEYVVGILYVDFEPGQRTEVLHIAFCPPLVGVPKIQLQQVDGPPMTATVGQAETFGARFELRLAQAWEESQRVVLQFETTESGLVGGARAQ